MAEETADSGLEGQNNPDLEAQQPDRPDWLPANFNDPADLAKSYTEAQAAKTRAEQRAAALEAQIAGIEAERIEAQQTQQAAAQQNDLVARIDQAREIGDTQTELALMAYIAQQAAAQAVPQQQQALPAEFVADYASNALARQYGDWDAYKDRAAGWLAQNSYLVTDEVAGNPQLLAQRLDVAYKAVKAEDLIAGNIPAQAPDLSQQKMVAQTMSGAGARQPSPDEAAQLWDRIRSAETGGFSTR